MLEQKKERQAEKNLNPSSPSLFLSPQPHTLLQSSNSSLLLLFLKLLFTEMLQLFFDGSVVMHVILNATCSLLNRVKHTARGPESAL